MMSLLFRKVSVAIVFPPAATCIGQRTVAVSVCANVIAQNASTANDDIVAAF